MDKRLQRIPYEGAVAGVCAGLGMYFGIDKTWVRIAFIVSVFFSGYMGIGLLGPIIYIVLWIVLPIKSFVLPHAPFHVDYRSQGPRSPSGFEDDKAPYAWENAVKPKVRSAKASKDRYVAGLILVVLGVFFLLHQLDLLYWRDFARFWPVLIIVLGLSTIFGAFKQRKSKPFSVNDTGMQEEQAPEHKPDESTGTESNDRTYTK